MKRLDEFKAKLWALLEEYEIPRFFVSVKIDGKGEVGFSWGKGMNLKEEDRV